MADMVKQDSTADKFICDLLKDSPESIELYLRGLFNEAEKFIAAETNRIALDREGREIASNLLFILATLTMLGPVALMALDSTATNVVVPGSSLALFLVLIGSIIREDAKAQSISQAEYVLQGGAYPDLEEINSKFTNQTIYYLVKYLRDLSSSIEIKEKNQFQYFVIALSKCLTECLSIPQLNLLVYSAAGEIKRMSLDEINPWKAIGLILQQWEQYILEWKLIDSILSRNLEYIVYFGEWLNSIMPDSYISIVNQD